MALPLAPIAWAGLGGLTAGSLWASSGGDDGQSSYAIVDIDGKGLVVIAGLLAGGWYFLRRRR
mgnify:CR=1 FL=1